MSLKDNWTDLIDGESEVVVKPINDMAHAIIEVEERTEEIGKNTNGYKQVVANALKGSASGEVVALKDVSPLEHGLRVRVSSKNLLDVSSILGKTVSQNGGTLSCGLDGGITGSGTPTGSTSFHSFTKINIPNGEYILSVTGDFKNLACVLYCFSKDGTRIKAIFVNNNISNVRFNTYDFPEGFYMSPEIKRKDDNVEMSGTAYFQLEKGTTATAYTPFVPDVGAVKVKAKGKNLISSDIWDDLFDKQEDGSYLSNQSIYFDAVNAATRQFYLPPAVYTISCDVKCEIDKNYRIAVVYEDDSFLAPYVESTGDYVHSEFVTEEKAIKAISWYYSHLSSNLQFKNLQIELDTIDTKYEPYIEPVEYAVNADGTVEGVKSIYPSTTLTTDTVGALIEVDYNRDINKAFAELQQAIISLGGNV